MYLECTLRSGEGVNEVFEHAARAAILEPSKKRLTLLENLWRDIRVNVKSKSGKTPFHFACYENTSCVCEMLKDSRVKVNEPDNNGSTPLYLAAINDRLDIIKWWIASGREMDLGKPGDSETDAIGGAKKNGETEVVTLLERFKSDAAKTRSEVRIQLRITGQCCSRSHSTFFILSS